MTLSEWHEATKDLPPRFPGDNVGCPRCGARKGERCRRWGGFRRSSPHAERVLAATHPTPMVTWEIPKARANAIKAVLTAARACVAEHRVRAVMERHPEDWHRVWSALNDAVDELDGQ